MFGINKEVNRDIKILETKFQIYEDLSKEMLDKLERAVDKISESNQTVALILERHENRLEQSERSDQILIGMIQDLKSENKEDNQTIINRIEIVENRTSDLAKFKWIATGIGTTAVIILGSAQFFGNLLTTGNYGANIGGTTTQQSK
jgi:DNA polymerase II small subunit/DNA polymerase delta subunit B